ncbi:unnamed protein product, partial [Prorocentrum cordatum]
DQADNQLPGKKWKCQACGCAKNAARSYYCKHCGAYKQVPTSAWSGDAARQLFGYGQLNGGAAWGKGRGGGEAEQQQKGTGGGYPKGGGQQPVPAGAAAAKFTAAEYETMAGFAERMGDSAGAAAHRRAAKALTAPKQAEEAIQVRLNRAHWKVHGINKRLESAVEKYEQYEAQLNNQKTVVLELHAELTNAEGEHATLLQDLVESQEAAKQPPTSAVQLALEDIMDQERLAKVFDISVSDLFRCDGVELDEADTIEIESRVQQLKAGLTAMAGTLFAEAKQKVDGLKSAHAQHIKRWRQARHLRLALRRQPRSASSRARAFLFSLELFQAEVAQPRQAQRALRQRLRPRFLRQALLVSALTA